MSQNSDVTIFEATGEVKISSSGFGAQYGIGNIIYNQISKGGTDRFHGSAYEYFQNDALNALPYAFGTHPKKGPLRYNNFGFNVGGPILPHRMFFFFDYDKTINNGGSEHRLSDSSHDRIPERHIQRRDSGPLRSDHANHPANRLAHLHDPKWLV